MKDVHRGAPPVDASLNQRRESPSITDGVRGDDFDDLHLRDDYRAGQHDGFDGRCDA